MIPTSLDNYLRLEISDQGSGNFELKEYYSQIIWSTRYLVKVLLDIQ